MKLKFDGIGVDSGQIIITDEANVHASKEDEAYLRDARSVSCGDYHVKYKLFSYGEVVEGEGELRISSGRIVVGDPCYIISHHDYDNKFLKGTYLNKEYTRINTGYLKKRNMILLSNFGGDGVFTVNVELIKKLD